MALSKNQIIVVVVAAIIVVAAVAAVALSGNGGNDDNDYDGGSVTITTYTDYNGNTAELTFDSIPDRVVVGCNTALNLLLYLGLGDRIVGVYYDEEEPWSEVEDEYNALCQRIGEVDASGSYHLSSNISTDVLLSWEPDLVIGWVSWNSDGLGTVDFFKDNGCNVMSFNTMTSSSYRTIEMMKTDYDNIGKIFDCESKTTDLYNQIVTVVNTISAAFDGSDSVTYCLVDGGTRSEGTIWMYNNSNFIASILNGFGFTNVNPDGRYVSLATIYEAIGTTDIDVIIFISYGSVSMEKSLESWTSDPDLAKCSAIQNQNYFEMKLSCSYGTSPELLDVLEFVYKYIKTEL